VQGRGKLQERSGPTVCGNGSVHERDKSEKHRTGKELPVVVNAALDFELKTLDRTHPYLRERGFSQRRFSVRPRRRVSRSLKDALPYPLHGHEGKLVGYAGGSLTDAAISEDNPRYRFPPDESVRHRLRFRKTLFV